MGLTTRTSTKAGRSVIRRALTALGWIVAASTLAAVAGSSTGPSSRDSTTGLVWGEEFGGGLDLSSVGYVGRWRANDVWQRVDRGYRDFSGSSWNLNPLETPGNSPFAVGGGVLAITAAATPASLVPVISSSMAAQGQSGGVPAWSGGMLISDPGQHQFRYGYIEIRAKLPSHAAGMFPAMWLYAVGGSSNAQNKGGAEIDLFEVFGDPSGSNWHVTTHYRDDQNAVTGPDVNVASVSTDTSQWHTYAVDWQPSYLRFFLDGVVVGEVTGAQAEYFDTPMSLRVNYAMNASWFPPDHQAVDTSAGPLTLVIDYIHTYATNPH
jgi:beta-glucanase (GH16 family)